MKDVGFGDKGRKKIFQYFFLITVISLPLIASIMVTGSMSCQSHESKTNLTKEIEKLSSSNPVERARAAYNLGEMGDRAIPAIPSLIKTLDDGITLEWEQQGMPSGSGMRTCPGVEATKALIKIGEPVVEPLIAALKNESPMKQEIIARIFGEIKDLRAVEPLISLLNVESDFVQKAAAAALGKITGQDLGRQKEKWQKWWERNKEERK